MIIRDPLSVLRRTGCSSMCGKCQSTHLFVFEAVRPSIRLTPLREYMRYQARYLLLQGNWRLKLLDRSGINWPELEQFMLDMSTANFVVGPWQRSKQTTSSTPTQWMNWRVLCCSICDTSRAYSRHFLALSHLQLRIMFWIDFYCCRI